MLIVFLCAGVALITEAVDLSIYSYRFSDAVDTVYKLSFIV